MLVKKAIDRNERMLRFSVREEEGKLRERVPREKVPEEPWKVSPEGNAGGRS
jgi:hypothetical protein